VLSFIIILVGRLLFRRRKEITLHLFAKVQAPGEFGN
jgi:hypothetical protein